MKVWQRLVPKKVNPQVVDDLMAKINREVEKMPPINILLVGKTGSGKSTLVNAIFREQLAETGIGRPVTQQIQKITKPGIPLTLYDTKGLELSAQAQREVLTSFSDLIQRQKAKGPREEIHLVYYCLNATMGRIEDYERDLIQTLAKQIPVILVLTQAIGQEYVTFEQYLRQQNWPVKAIVPILAKPYLIQKKEMVSSFGLQALIDQSLAVIPSQVHQAFINAQQIDIQLKLDKARSWAKTYVTSAFGVGFTPIPVADAALLVPMQITMLAHLSAIFGLSLDKAQLVSLIAGLGGTTGTTVMGRMIVANAMKWIPGLGTISGGILSGVTAGALTLALAYSYIEMLHQIAKAELTGRDLPMKELQKLMNRSFDQQLAEISKHLPNAVKDKTVSQWVDQYFKTNPKS
ncbi:YcjF family protein [Vaginisenegalia massiliensis]|uniref:YcjF family protein n=1 Tax=Vaginisenegalia massiliensis TaxID=2058294 RepID=UPI000F540E57|nr:GTPase [Vaginisenegalia massiliensis]